MARTSLCHFARLQKDLHGIWTGTGNSYENGRPIFLVLVILDDTLTTNWSLALTLFRIVMEQLLPSNLVIVHLQAWLLHIQVTTNRQHHISTHHSSTHHNNTHHIRTHQHTKCHRHMLQHQGSIILWVTIKQDSWRMKRLERQMEFDKDMQFYYFWCFRYLLEIKFYKRILC